MRRIPVFPTLLVLAAVATMIGLGIWQIQRAHWKDRLLARYAAAQDLPPVAFPAFPAVDDELPLFRRSSATCLRPVSRRTIGGRSLTGDVGYSQVVECSTGAEGPGLAVDIGWSRNPNIKIDWQGGEVSGIIVPDSRRQLRLVADRAATGLQPSAPPSIDEIPNNHRMYVLTWFLFAGLALLIYVFALRRRLKDAAQDATLGK